MLRILVCCPTVPKLSPVSLCRPDHSAGDQQRCSGRVCTVQVHITCSTMASGDDRSSRSKDDHSGVNFHNKLRVSWNAPTFFIDLDSPGIVARDTSVISDVLGLKAFYADAEPLRVLPGMAENIIRVFIPDNLAEPRGFQDILLEDMTTEIVPAISAGDMNDLRTVWPNCQGCRSVRLTGSRSAGSVCADLASSLWEGHGVQHDPPCYGITHGVRYGSEPSRIV